MTVDHDLLRRFHRVLVREIRDSKPEYLEAPFTVAEIYQHLVPYRTHRDELGVEMNGDYEDALLRLLGGEGDYLILDSEPALKRIRRELENPEPNTGLFREFAAAEVRLNPERVVGEQLRHDSEMGAPVGASDPEGATGGGGGPSEDRRSALESEMAELGMAGSAVSTATTTEDADEVEMGPTAAARPSTPEPSPATLQDLPADCPDCDERLPRREGLRFCPFCGVNVHLVPCGGCGAELERAWSYCIFCGSAVDG